MEWSLQPAIFKLGWYELRWYSLLFASGFLVGYFIMQKIFKNEGKSPESVDTLVFYTVVATVIGARLGHVIFYEPHWFTENPFQILKVWEGGLASHGAAITIPFAIWLFARKYKLPFLWVIDRMAICVALAGCFIRIGNFCNSEIIGNATDVPWAIKFMNVDAVARHPVQLYESLGYFLIFLLLGGIYRRMGSRTPHGLLVGLFFALVFSHRIAMEFFKTRQAHFLDGFPLDMGQILSIPCVIIGIVLAVRALKSNNSAQKAK